jgi:hypothetical protein
MGVKWVAECIQLKLTKRKRKKKMGGGQTGEDKKHGGKKEIKLHTFIFQIFF